MIEAMLQVLVVMILIIALTVKYHLVHHPIAQLVIDVILMAQLVHLHQIFVLQRIMIRHILCLLQNLLGYT